MPIIELDPEIAWKAIEGYQNELDADVKKLDAFYRQFVCIRPQCGGNVQREVIAGQDGGHAFGDPDHITARSVLRCMLCNCLFDPHSELVLERGRPL